jgi:molybdopterin-synthase adenylyltransferase
MSAEAPAAARFARQLEIPDLGPQALARLRSARVHVVGAGPTAGPALVLLAQAGVGTLFLDDGGDVLPSDPEAWLYGPADAGAQRPLAALPALRAVSAALEVRLLSSESQPTAALVCPESEGAARSAAERARRAGLPLVVGLSAREGGEVVVVPPGAPCFRCASPPSARVPPGPASAAAIGALAALELVLLVARTAGPQVGRRIDLVDGWPSVRETARRPGCDCHVAY